MERNSEKQASLMAKAGNLFVRYSGMWIVVGLAITLLLAVPLIAMSPDEDASSDPGGDVFDLQDDLGDWFKTIVHDQNYVIEARGEDVLTQAVLWELYQNTQEFLAIDKRVHLARRTYRTSRTYIKPSTRILTGPLLV